MSEGCLGAGWRERRYCGPGSGPVRRRAPARTPGVLVATAALGFLVASAAVPPRSFADPPRRAAYFYDYMSLDHLDSLAAAHFNHALVRLVGDSIGIDQAARIRAFVGRGRELGIGTTPDLLVQSRRRLETLGTTRRYTWGRGTVEPNVACPMDSAYWKSALFERADDLFEAVPGLTGVAADLELYFAGRKHYDAGPCRCAACLAEYTGQADARTSPGDAWKLSGLLAYQESRLAAILTSQLRRFAGRHPGAELAVLDLDYDSFVHRALARALARARVPTTNYCERSYRAGGVVLAGARTRLQALGLKNARLVGGLWLKRWAPRDLPYGVRSILERADGYFAFTTYSLWLDPSRLSGPYTLPGSTPDYWRAFQEVNRSP